MVLEKILIVNDDTEDILAMQARFPDGLEVVASSQWQTCMLTDMSEFGLIVLDNDANSLKESKGKKTLEHIRGHNSDVPVIYTSFQPGWVDGDVYKTNGVDVIRTDQALEQIAKRFDLELKEPVVKEGPDPELNIIFTYNPVEGYSEGVFSNGKLLIASYPKHAQVWAKEVLGQKIQRIYQDFDWRTDRDIVRNIFVYDGVNGGDMPGQIANSLGHDTRMKVNLMACGCNWEEKKRFASSTYTNLYKVECSGRDTLGSIADVILGVKRPGINYDQLPISQEKILEKAERFQM